MNHKIAIFYHVGQLNDWQDVFNEQIRKMQHSGLYDASQFIFCGINGNQPIAASNKVIGSYNSNHVLEADTLKQMWSFAKANPGYKLLYLHTKGVTWTNEIRPLATSWRRFMESYVIKRWRQCIEHLDTHDTCGVMLQHKAYYNTYDDEKYTVLDATYYDGNFWWANSDYIARLDPNYLYTDDTPWLRGKSELWIGTGNPNAYTMRNLEYVNPYFYDYGDINEYC